MPGRRKGKKPTQSIPSGSNTLPATPAVKGFRQESNKNPTPKRPTPPGSPSSIPDAIATHTGPSIHPATSDGGWPRLIAFSKLFDRSTGSLSPLKSVVQEMIGCTEIYGKVAGGTAEFKKLQIELECLFEELQQHFDEYMPQSITLSIESLCRSISKELNYIKNKQARNRMHKYFEAKEDSESILACYRRIRGHLQRLVLNSNISIWKVVDDRATDARLDRLNPSFSARYNSRQATELRRGACTSGTRIDVLAQMHAWVYDPAAGPVCWINGMAGTGKTTIAYSLCDELGMACNLGASFFCSRLLPECRDVNQIVPSIAYQLAEFSRPFRCALARVLEKERNAHTLLLSIQFEVLIMKPLVEALDALPENLVVVIDALDECDDKQSTVHILEILLTKSTVLPIKFLIASRPESEIRRMFGKQQNNPLFSRLVLHELDRGTVQGDIGTFLRDALLPIKPSNDEITALVKRSTILFIYAATVARYISYNGFTQNPRKRLRNILDMSPASGDSPYKDIDRLYHLIVDAALNDPNISEDEKDDRQLVLYTVLCAQEPLKIGTLSRLLALGDIERVHAALQPLWSVLHVIESSDLVTTLHASFPEYMFDPNRSGDNHCNPAMHHLILAQCCFGRIKNSRPQFNICGLESSYIPDERVPELDKRIQGAISSELFYACRHWAGHLEYTHGSPELITLLRDFLSIRFLLWMEVMNLRQCIHIAVLVMGQAGEWCKHRGLKALAPLIEDAWRFTIAFASNPVSRSTCHIYVSMLPFWPHHNPIGTKYMPRFQGPVARGKSIANRNFALLADWPFSEPASLVIWSPDGVWIALIIRRKIQNLQIYDSYSGRPALEIRTSDTVQLATFSPNGAYILSVSFPDNICLWDTSTGRLVLGPVGIRFTGDRHDTAITCVAYSPNNVHVVTGSYGGEVCVLDSRDGQVVVGPIIAAPNHESIVSVVFSPDGSRFTSLSQGTDIMLWDTATGGALCAPLKGNRYRVAIAAFSPDGSRIISTTNHTKFAATIRMWDTQTAQPACIPLKGHTGSVDSIAFSQDGKYVVSGSSDHKIIVWNAKTGELVLGPLASHTAGVISVAYSPDGSRIASASMDNTIRIWSTRATQRIKDLAASHTGPIRSVAFSPDGARLVTASDDDTLLIWNAQTGQVVLGPLEGHTNSVTSASFSFDGSRVVSGSSDTTILMWRARKGSLILGPFEGHSETVGSVTFSPNDARILSCSYDCTIRIWDSQTGKTIIGPLCGHESWVLSAAFSRDGSRIVSSSRDKTIRIWDAQTGQALFRPFTGHTGCVNSASFSPSATQIVSGSDDNTVRVWNVRTGKIDFLPMKEHSKPVVSTVFSSDGARFASGSHDGSVRIWTVVERGGPSSRVLNHNKAIESIAFAPDGARIVAGDSGGAVHMWHASGKKPMKSRRADLKWNLCDDGWVVDESTPSRLLVWVPAEFRQMLSTSPPGDCVWNSDDDKIKLDFNYARIGEDWSQCYQSQGA